MAAEISYLKQRQAAHNNAAEALVYVDKTLGDKQIEQTRKTSADIIQHERDIAAASGKTGEARVNEDIKADRRILEYTKLTAQDRFDVQRDLNSKLGELHGQQAAAAINADNETRERTLRSLQKQAQDFRQGTQERVDADQKWLKYAVKAFGQYSDEAEAANDAVVADQRAHTHQLIDDSARLSENRVKDINETADEAVRALDQERKYFNLTADAEIAAAKRIEDERDKNANQALSDALKAANGEQDIVSRVDKEIEEERRKHQKRLSDIARQGLDEQVQDWSRFNQRITSAEDELVGDIFQGDKSLWQNLRDVGLRFLEQMIADDVKFWTERELLALEGVKAENAAEHGGFTDFIRLLTQRTTAATAAQGTQTSVTVTGQAVQTAATASGTATREAIGQSENSSFLGRVFSEIAQWLGLESAKTAATTAGAEARVTAEETARAQGKAAELASGSAEILNDAYKAAAGAYNAVVSIPVIGPVLAPIAAGVAFAAVSAYDQLTSAEGGLERVDSAEKLMITHRDESVLPARISRPLMSFVGDLPAMAELVKQNSAPAFDPRTSAPDPSNSVSAVVARAGSPDLRSIADVGSLLPVTSPSASLHTALRAQSPQSDADYVASQVSGGGRASASSSPASSKNRGGDIHIHAWDASSMNQFFRKPSNRRTMDQISKDRVRHSLHAVVPSAYACVGEEGFDL